MSAATAPAKTKPVASDRAEPSQPPPQPVHAAPGAEVGSGGRRVAGAARREATAIFVSRGVGTVYIPVRVNCPPEVALLTLQPVDPTSD